MISVVIPCYNEQEVIPALYHRVTAAAAETWNEPYEVIIVDDGSIDETYRLVLEIHTRDARWKILQLARNFGHQVAISAGMYYAKGDCVVIIDADLQDSPEEICRFIAKWREGYDVVYAIRTERKENFIKRICYKTFYRILGGLASIPIPYDAGDFCLIDRKVLNIINAMPERNRFVRGLRAWVGFRQIGLVYKRDARAAGDIKYKYRDLVKLALDGIFSFSTAPLKLSTYLGFACSFFAILGSIFTFFQKIFTEWFSQFGLGILPGFATTFISIMFLGGVQLICLGIIGEYLGRIYEEVKQRPVWTIKEKYGIETNQFTDSSAIR
jgi:dolichol-phosphate mannosyltransferase